jgi:hypothetical protein
MSGYSLETGRVRLIPYSWPISQLSEPLIPTHTSFTSRSSNCFLTELSLQWIPFMCDAVEIAPNTSHVASDDWMRQASYNTSCCRLFNSPFPAGSKWSIKHAPFAWKRIRIREVWTQSEAISAGQYVRATYLRWNCLYIGSYRLFVYKVFCYNKNYLCVVCWQFINRENKHDKEIQKLYKSKVLCIWGRQ